MVEPVLILGWFFGVAQAEPYRSPPVKPQQIRWTQERHKDRLIVKLVEDGGLAFDENGLRGPGDISKLRRTLQGARRLFRRPVSVIAADAARVDPKGRLADLNLYLRLDHPDAVSIGNVLLRDPRVETVYLAPLPTPPPGDIEPETPDFVELQGYLGPAPGGFGFDVAAAWPGGRGGNVAVADLEYSWEPTHEDLMDLTGVITTGVATEWYPSHGNAVISMLVGGDNGYGVLGMVPDAQLVVSSPFMGLDDYDVAVAIDEAVAVLDAGDVLLIEQQGVVDGRFAPVEVEPAVFDAITLAVAKGVVVVEPSGNGALDLDGAAMGDWFDRSVRDSGAIMVGGGASPAGVYEARTWFLGGSSFGSRIDVQGWFDGIIAATTDEYGADWADLFFPGADTRQAYTSQMGGTSGAAPMVASVAVVANSVAWELWGEPWDPMDLRAAMIQTGTPQPASDVYNIGPQPDLRRLLRTWMVR